MPHKLVYIGNIYFILFLFTFLLACEWTGTMHKPSIYSRIRVKYSRRGKFTPIVGHVWRPRVVAWAGPDAFTRDRFYELDPWYKARIQKPELLPKLHIIDPDTIVESYMDKILRRKERRIDIGFKRQEMIGTKRTTDGTRATLEELAIRNQLLIELNTVDSSNQLSLAEHFNIMDDLFMPGVFFHNVQSFEINIGSGKVMFGNTIHARDSAKPPSVAIKSPQSGLKAFNTLLMLNLEGTGQEEVGATDSSNNKTKDGMELNSNGTPRQQSTLDSMLDQQLVRMDRHQLLHWMVANIPDSHNAPEADISAGTELIPYLQPVPFYGTGYHRFVFILFRHRNSIDFSAFDRKNVDSLLGRMFNTNRFYKQFEDVMSPSAFRFCQIKWDESCDRALHRLGLKAPRYWYEWNEQMKPEQKEFPMKSMPFHHYLNMYRNPETIRKEVQRKRLELLVKLKPGEKLEPAMYPDIDYMNNRVRKPQFEHERLIRQNAGEGVWAALYHNYENPLEQHEMEKYQHWGFGEREEKDVGLKAKL